MSDVPRTVRNACNPVQPGATPCNPTQRPTRFGETNPIFTADPEPGRRSVTLLALAAGAAVEALSPALRAACDVVQHGATPRDAVQQIPSFGKTNPIRPPTTTGASRSAMVGGSRSQSSGVMAGAGSCNAMQHRATPRNVVQQNPPPCETNPIADSPLGNRQLAAARLLAAGRSITQAATELKLCRSTVWRWQREPVFRAELRRIHERMIAPASRR